MTSRAQQSETQLPLERQRGLYRLLGQVPLAARMVLYSTFFLGIMLVALPWLAFRVDVLWPRLHTEIGWFRIAGAIWFAACLATYLYCSFVLAWRGRGAYVEFDPPREFVCVGPYRWVRNPIAACVVGMLLGLAVALSSTGVFLLFLISLPLAHLQVVLIEEPLLEKRFGQSYLGYKALVPRWLPRRPRAQSHGGGCRS